MACILLRGSGEHPGVRPRSRLNSPVSTPHLLRRQPGRGVGVQDPPEQVLQLHGHRHVLRVGHAAPRDLVVQVQHGLTLQGVGSVAMGCGKGTRPDHAGWGMQTVGLACHNPGRGKSPPCPVLERGHSVPYVTMLPLRPQSRHPRTSTIHPPSPITLRTDVEGYLPVDEEVQADPQRPHVGLPASVCLPGTHLWGCGAKQREKGEDVGEGRRSGQRMQASMSRMSSPRQNPSPHTSQA